MPGAGPRSKPLRPVIAHPTPCAPVKDQSADLTLCPSAPAAEGASLIGIVAPDGRVVNIGTPLPVDRAFLDAAQAHGPLEARFRFSSPCQKERCGHWAGTQCKLIGELLDLAVQADVDVTTESLPRCSIRAQCRWWRQRGRSACAVCPLIVTDTRSATG
jgi:hypothetical protein